MPTGKTTDALNQDVHAVRKRVGDLADRIATLESDLKRTQERIQDDMKRLVEMATEERRK